MLSLTKAQVIRNLFQWGKHFRVWIFVGVAMLVIGVLLVMKRDAKVIAKLENDLLDAHFLARGYEPSREDIVIVGIDDLCLMPSIIESIDRSAHPALEYISTDWPWDRRFYAHVIERLSNAGARLIVFDFTFGSPSGDADFDLADAIEAHKERIILPTRFLVYKSDLNETSIIYEIPFDDLLPLDDSGMLGFTNVESLNEEGVIRRLDYATSQLERSNPFKYGGRVEDDLFALSYVAAEKIKGVEAQPSIDELIINFTGAAKSYSYVSAYDLFLPSRWNNNYLAAGEFFKDKIVFVGPLAERFKDSHPTPFGIMPGVEIHANALETFLDGNYYKEVSSTNKILLSCLLIFVIFWICLRIEQVITKALSIVLIYLIVAFIAQITFEKFFLFVPLVLPFISSVICGAFYITFDFSMTQYDRFRMRRVLDRYVSKNIADHILKDSDSFEERLQGRKGNVTVFFSDIRGFTTLSERLDPPALVELLNEYLYGMVDIVLNEGGTLSKYIGDAIMAVWGDTYALEEKEGARKGVQSAMQMSAKMLELNRDWKARGKEVLNIGMGVNFGVATIGNIGHPQRVEFTVLGDTVNFAARLESATKAYRQEILVGDAAYQLTQEDFAYRYVDRMQVVGKTEAVAVYTPIVDLTKEGATVPEWLNLYEAAILQYLKREFSLAIESFKKANEATPEQDDFLCQMYMERCQLFMKHPPPLDWDGSHQLTSK